MLKELRKRDSLSLFQASIEGMAFRLDNQIVPPDPDRAVFYIAMLTPILNELAHRYERLPDRGADWFNLPCGSTFADFVDLIRRTDARELTKSVRLAYSFQANITD